MKKTTAILACACAAGAGAYSAPAFAMEGAAGFYLLGSKTSMAGFIPPPGTYLADTNYYYSGSADVDLNIGGLKLSGGIDANVYYNLPTALWVGREKVLGGNIAFNLVVPVGWKDISAGATITSVVGGPPIFSAGLDEAGTHFGDPVAGASLGWHDGNWHWTIGSLVNIPIGYWEEGDVTSTGFNRWGIDTTGAITYLDPATGLELSGAVGFTFNFENPDTDYKSGTEFHVEFAAVQNFSKSFGVGINGFFYDQLTGDSGTGAKLGSFEGQALALGPVVNLNFECGKIPVSASLKYFREFEVENRLTGDSGFLTVSMPLP